MRFWELDAWRGTAAILMLIYHGLWDLEYFKILAFDTGHPLYFALRLIIVISFFTLIGIGARLHAAHEKRNKEFKRHLLMRISKLAGLSLLITVGSYLMFPEYTVWFGVLHFIAVATLIGSVCTRNTRSISLAPFFALLSILLGIIVKKMSGPAVLLPLGISHPGFMTFDYYPLFPWIALVFLGIYIGQWWLSKKPTSMPKCAIPIVFIGRHALIFYVLHLPLLYALTYLYTILAAL